MAFCTIRTPDSHIDATFSRLSGFLQRYKVTADCAESWAPGVCGYGIDEQCPTAQDPRDNRWLVWAARYIDPDDEFLSQTARTILSAAFTPDGVEHHHHAAPHADDYHHYYIWWLLQVALGYLYTADTSLDSQHLRRIVQTLFSVFDEADKGITHTAMYYFVTSIGEPANTDPGKAYSFYHGTNLLFVLQQFEHLANARGDTASAGYFRERAERLREQLQRFRSADGFYFALRDLATGKYRYRVTGKEDLCLMTDNVFAPLAYGVLSVGDLEPSVDFLLPRIAQRFPVPYAYPPYRGAWTNAWWFPRSWQEPFAHYCLALRELEKPSLIYRAIQQLAHRIAQDDEVWEHYDPHTGEPQNCFIPPRRGYSTTSACFNIAVVETLFGIRPLEPGFQRVSFRPAFPEDWTSAQIDTTVSGCRICYTMTASPDRIVYDFRGSSTVEASLCLPLPVAWSGKPVEANVPGVLRTMRGEPRPCLDTQLGLGEGVVELTVSA